MRPALPDADTTALLAMPIRGPCRLCRRGRLPRSLEKSRRALADADATALLAMPIRGRAGFAGAAAYPGRWKRAAGPWPTPTPRRCLQCRSEAVPALPARPLTPVVGKEPPGLGRRRHHGVACNADQRPCRLCRRGRLPRSLEKSRLALADADTKRREAVTPSAPTQLVQQRHDEPRAAHPERMAEGDSATVHVHLLRVQAQLVDDDEALRRESLVQLDEIELAHLDIGACQHLLHRRNRTDPHYTRIDTRNGRAHEGAERLDAKGAGLPLVRDHDRRRAVVDPARITRR